MDVQCQIVQDRVEIASYALEVLKLFVPRNPLTEAISTMIELVRGYNDNQTYLKVVEFNVFTSKYLHKFNVKFINKCQTQ